MATVSAKSNMEAKVFIAKLLLITRTANTINGMFTAISRRENETPVIFVNKSEMPVAPPSINPLGNKKPFNPKPADKILRVNNIRSFTRLLYFICSFF